MSEVEETPEEIENGKGLDVLGCLRAIAWMASPVAIYFGLLWLFGLWPGAAVGWPFYLGGAFLSILVMFFMALMGETTIEDVVKFSIFALAAWGLSRLFEAPGQAVVVGMVAGAAMPLVYRLWPGVK